MEEDMIEAEMNGTIYKFPARLLDFMQIEYANQMEESTVRNIVSVVNRTSEEYYDSKRRFQTNLFIEGPILYGLIVLYSFLIIFGTVGNCLTGK
jgi:hypothetical protein